MDGQKEGWMEGSIDRLAEIASKNQPAELACLNLLTRADWFFNTSACFRLSVNCIVSSGGKIFLAKGSFFFNLGQI